MEKVASMAVEELLVKFTKQKYAEADLKSLFPNPLLRQDVLSLLDRFCMVIYYPLNKEEKNNGFHLHQIPFLDPEKLTSVVLINTSQTIEKQIFTAAHELGHVWKVDDYVLQQTSELEDNKTNREMIVNRFAAALLMPEKFFRSAFAMELAKMGAPESTLDVIDTLKLIAALMNRFFVPKKSVIYRFVELDIISEQDGQLLLGESNYLTKEEIDDILCEIYVNCGYREFLVPTEKKSINGLADLLDRAEKNGVVPQIKIDRLREEFGLSRFSENAMDVKVSVSSEKGVD